MTTDTAVTTERDALADRLFNGVLGMIDIQMTYVGDRLGFYRALAAGDATADELAAATATHPRYVREWLEQQAVAGMLAVDDAAGDAELRRYSLAHGHEEVFTDPDSLVYMAPFARMMVGIARRLPDVLGAFRSGEGVPYADYDEDFCVGQADMNRTMFVNQLASEWFPAIPAVHERLRSNPPARVADVACGAGYSTLALADAYPLIAVDGIDLDDASIAMARAALAASPHGARVSFAARDAADPGLQGTYDLVTVFEAIHDMSAPVEVLRGIRGLLAADGCVIVADERVAEHFTAPGDEVEQLMYGYSVLACLPMGMAECPSAMTGTAMRPATMRQYASAAGFSSTEILPIENAFWRFYQLTP